MNSSASCEHHALISIVLLLAGALFTAVGDRDPNLLYVSTAGPRLVENYPHLLPGWWFNLFPEAPGLVQVHGTLALDRPSGAGFTTTWVDIPPSRYAATFTVPCAPSSRSASSITLGVNRQAGDPPPLTALHVVALTTCTTQEAVCSGNVQAVQVSLPFTSDGYELIGFSGAFAEPNQTQNLQVTYAPIP